MIKRLVLLLVVILTLSGCANLNQAFDADSPGKVPWAGGNLQLLFSNTDYANPDPLIRQQILEEQLYDRRSGNDVTGGVGLMQVWRFGE